MPRMVSSGLVVRDDVLRLLRRDLSSGLVGLEAGLRILRASGLLERDEVFKLLLRLPAGSGLVGRDDDLKLLLLFSSGLDGLDGGFRMLLLSSGLLGRDVFKLLLLVSSGVFRLLLLTSSGLEGLDGGFKIPTRPSGVVGREGGLRIPLALSSGLVGRDEVFKLLFLPLSSGLCGLEGGLRIPFPAPRSSGLVGREGGLRMPRVTSSGLVGREGRFGGFMIPPEAAVSGSENVTTPDVDSGSEDAPEAADSGFRIPLTSLWPVGGGRAAVISTSSPCFTIFCRISRNDRPPSVSASGGGGAKHTARGETLCACATSSCVTGCV